MEEIEQMIIDLVAIHFNIRIEIVEKALTDVEYLQQLNKEDSSTVDKILDALNKIKKDCEKESHKCMMRLSKYDTDANVNAYISARTMERYVLSYINYIRENRVAKRSSR